MKKFKENFVSMEENVYLCISIGMKLKCVMLCGRIGKRMVCGEIKVYGSAFW